MTTGKVPVRGVVLSRLCKSYGQVQAVRPLDLVIAPGETVAILGPNGAGKTTVLDMMLGLTRPDSGSVSLFGMPPARAARAGIISGMLQTGVPVDRLRVRELLTMVASLYSPHFGNGVPDTVVYRVASDQRKPRRGGWRFSGCSAQIRAGGAHGF